MATDTRVFLMANGKWDSNAVAPVIVQRFHFGTLVGIIYKKFYTIMMNYFIYLKLIIKIIHPRIAYKKKKKNIKTDQNKKKNK